MKDLGPKKLAKLARQAVEAEGEDGCAVTGRLTIEMSLQQAEMLDIVWCTCGHRPNNHFDFDKLPCAHCDCKEYQQVIYLPEEE